MVAALLWLALVSLTSTANANEDSSAEPAAMPPLSAYGKLPEIEDAALSPSGNRIAALMTVNDTRLLVAFDNDNSVITRMSVNEMKIRTFDWVGEDRLLITYTVTEDLGYNFAADKHEFAIAAIIPVSDTANGMVVFQDSRKLVDSTFGNYGLRQINGRWYGFFGALELVRNSLTRRYEFDHGRPYLYRVDLQDNTTLKIGNAASPDHDNDWLVDANGEIAATHDINRNNGSWTIRNASRDVIAQGVTPSGRTGLIGLGYDGDTAIFYDADPEGRILYFEVPLAGGDLEPFLPDIDYERLFFDDQTGHLTGYREDAAGKSPVFRDLIGARV